MTGRVLPQDGGHYIARLATSRRWQPLRCAGARRSRRDEPDSGGVNPPLDDDLRRLVEAWPTLPDPVRVGILAMIEAARQAL